MSEIYHHGIDGMKWGIRNGPPYPLSQSQKSKSEKAHEKVSTNKTRHDFYIDNKTLINVGATVTLSALAVVGAAKLANSSSIDNLINIGQLAVQNIGEPLSNNSNLVSLKKLVHPETIKNSIAKANGSYNPDSSNCMFTVLASELRQRGFDVSAENTNKGIFVEKFTNFFTGFDSKSFCEDIEMPVPNVSMETKNLYRNPNTRRLVINDLIKRGKIVEQSIAKQLSDYYPDNSRGLLAANLEFQNHGMFWVKENGIVTIYDPQSKNRMKYIGLGLMKDVKINSETTKIVGIPFHQPKTIAMRLDNLELRPDTINELIMNGILKNA